MATLPSNQPDAQRGVTAPSNDLSVEIVNDTQTGGMSGSAAAGSVAAGVSRPTEQR
jgi:hypothetical protein